MHPLNFEIPEATWLSLKIEAERRGMPMSSYIKDILTDKADSLREKKAEV